jgi:hypothetical protein
VHPDSVPVFAVSVRARARVCVCVWGGGLLQVWCEAACSQLRAEPRCRGAACVLASLGMFLTVVYCFATVAAGAMTPWNDWTRLAPPVYCVAVQFTPDLQLVQPLYSLLCGMYNLHTANVKVVEACQGANCSPLVLCWSVLPLASLRRTLYC